MVDDIPLSEPPHTTDLSSSMVAGGEKENISLLDLLIILATRKRMILTVVLLFAVTAAVVSLLLPPQYEASVSVLTPEKNSTVSASLGSQLGSLGGASALAGLGIKNPNDMFVGMLKGHSVEDAMVKRFDLMHEYKTKYLSDARKAFEAHATVDGSGKDGLIHISVEDRDPNRAAELAAGYVDEFRVLSQHLAITEAARRKLFFEQELETAKNNLAKAEEDLKQTQQTTGLIQLDSQARALIESAGSLRAQIAAKEVQIRSMQTYFGPGNVELLQSQQELEGLRAELTKLGGIGTGTGSELVLPKGQIPQAGLEYVRRLRDVKYYEKIFEILAQQFELATLDEAKEGAMIQVVDPATPPDRKSSPKRGLMVIIASLAGFVVGIVIAFSQAAWGQANLNPDTSAKLTMLRSSAKIRG